MKARKLENKYLQHFPNIPAQISTLEVYIMKNVSENIWQNEKHWARISKKSGTVNSDIQISWI